MATFPITNQGDVPPAYRKQLWSLTGVFDSLILGVFPRKSLSWIKRASRLLLRKLYTNEETEEIKGISSVTGIDLYLLVALNVLLDSFMGCTSGGALAQLYDGEPRMLHFRTLDWDMDSLRRLVVQLQFVRSPHTDHVLATSITCVGYVGVLTGLRRRLSLSLNLRANHDDNGALSHYRFYASHLLVLLGIRRSISSLLRQYLIPPPPDPKTGLFARIFQSKKAQPHPYTASLDYISATLPNIPTTAAYLIFSDGIKTVVIEKDLRSAVTASSSSFIVATNSDLETFSPSYNIPESTRTSIALASGGAVDIRDVILDSRERQALMQGFWDRKVMEHRRHKLPKRSEFHRTNLPRQPVRRNPPRNARRGQLVPDMERMTLGAPVGWIRMNYSLGAVGLRMAQTESRLFCPRLSVERAHTPSSTSRRISRW